MQESGHQDTRGSAPLPTLLALEHTIQSRREAAEASHGAPPRPMELAYLILLMRGQLPSLAAHRRGNSRMLSGMVGLKSRVMSALPTCCSGIRAGASMGVREQRALCVHL